MPEHLPFEVFLQDHFVFSMAVLSHGAPYSASCFYVYLPDEKNMVFVSDPETTHMKAVLESSLVAGSVYRETEVIREIQGIQFQGQLRSLTAKEMKQSRRMFNSRFPYARLNRSTAWQIQINWVKFTDNTRGFGFKEIWKR